MRGWKLWTGLLVIFIAGVVAGSAAAVLYIRANLAEVILSNVPQGGRIVTEKISRDLDLTPEQHTEVKRIVHERRRNILLIQKQLLPDIDKELYEAVAEMKTFLTPEQGRKLQNLLDRVLRIRDEIFSRLYQKEKQDQ